MDGARAERARAGAALLATCASTAWIHLAMWSRLEPSGPALARSLSFSLTLLGILGVHEVGHRAAASRCGIRMSLPLFLPAPVLFGTFGALIGLRAPPPDRRGLLQMAVGGPAAGLAAVAGVLLVHGLFGSPPPAAGASPVALALPLGWRAAAALGIAPAEVDPSDPLPFAAWIAVWITGANLLPFGQLDGGHVFGAAFPGWRAAGSLAVAAGLALAGIWWSGWWMWLAVLGLLGGWSPLEPERTGPLPSGSRWLALATLVVCAACFSPVPFR